MLFIYADGDDAWRREQNQRLAAQLNDAGSEAAVIEIAAEHTAASTRTWARISTQGC